MDGLQVSGALQPHDGVHGQPGEVVLVVGEQFGGQRGACDVQQVLLEASRVVAAVKRRRRLQESLLPHLTGEQKITDNQEVEEGDGRTCGPWPPPSEPLGPPEWPSSSQR